MVEKVDPLDNEYFTNNELFLAVLIDHLANIDKNSSRFVGEKSTHTSVSENFIQYLKEVDEYRAQFELCLKMFDGKTGAEFSDNFIESVKTLFENYTVELVDEVLEFASDNINQDKKIDFDFNEVNVSNEVFNNLLYDKFTFYGSKILSNHPQPHACKIARISYSSKTTRNRMKGKLRRLGKYASIDDVIEFIDIRIGLFREFKYKKLVDSLDDLASDFLINSSTGKLKKSKAKLTTKQLIKEAVRKYEVYNSPKYLIDQNAYQEALRNKIKSTLKR